MAHLEEVMLNVEPAANRTWREQKRPIGNEMCYQYVLPPPKNVLPLAHDDPEITSLADLIS